MTKVALEKTSRNLQISGMSKNELQKFANRLSIRERGFLRAYLWMLDRVNNPAWKAEMARRRREMEAGNGISSTEYFRRVRTIDRARERTPRKRKAA